jgi:ring-1,2-phenylacetyl-CoA epoxidase subunit PaaC
VDRDRAVPGGGRRLLVDRAERGRPRAGAVRAGAHATSARAADELAFDREPSEYRCSELVELRLPEWERTIARHVLYEQADAERLERLKASDDPEVAGLAAKIDREEIYHRLHAEMWHARLQDEPRYVEALEELRPLVGRRNGHAPELTTLWEEMTSVRRSQPAGTTW